MNEHDLFLAIGRVDDAYLTGEKQHRPKEGKRILWRMGLIAALVSLLVITVSAAPVILGALAVRMHAFAGYSGVVTFALPYCAVYAASVYLLGMNEGERGLVRSVARRLARR